MNSLSRLNMLVVDDNEFTLSMMERQLLDLGVGKVMALSSGAEAASVLARQRFDLVLTDWYMPDINGAGIVKLVRDERFTTNKGIPVVVMTAYATSENLTQAKALGVTDILIKPIEKPLLAATLNRVVAAIPARFGVSGDSDDYFAI